MKDTGYGACAEEKELLSIAKDCLYAAEKLKSATNKLVSPSVKGNALRSIYAGVSAKYKEGRLQRLEATVNRHQTRLESHLLMKIWYVAFQPSF
ncbi:hypothetical protein SEUCBS140593_005564 [Sporothrix eucalyptigena]|uniref:Uncharacterized protein n=1 Tax=Sporothrix eucalyptigena TaxID=1812306 RepID=A0ABP0BXG2_9PEZI